MKKVRERRVVSKPTAGASRPKCEKRRTRERRRNSTTNRILSTDGTTSGEDVDNATENGVSGTRQATNSHDTANTMRASERTRVWIRCQSDLDADCEDNSTDFDSVSHCALDSSPSHHKLSLPFESNAQAASVDSSSNETESLREKIEHLETHVRKLTEENRMLSEENRRLRKTT
uniref:cGMP-dependent protein kinase interacting domain-containing protein n=1 Tax=Ascaris lumbricoides TaxID=6252 RepID=A0A9J2Q068_ASCLU